MSQYLALILFFISCASSQAATGSSTYFDPASFALDNTFTSSQGSLIQYTCFNETYLGPFTGNAQLFRSWTDFEPHWKMTVSYEVVLFDTASQGNVIFEANGVRYMNVSFESAEYAGISDCRNLGKDYAVAYSFDLYRIKTLDVVWYSLNSAYLDQAWGINAISITLTPCLDNCQECSDSTRCQVCKTGYYLFHGDTSDTCKACPTGATSCELNHTTGMLSYGLEFDTLGTAVSGWTTNPAGGPTACCSTCGGVSTSAFYSNSYSLTKTWTTLPVHSSIEFSFDAYAIDAWSNHRFYVSLPPQSLIKEVYSDIWNPTRTQDLCGASTFDAHDKMTANFTHTATTLTARIGADVLAPSAFAINNLIVKVSICYDEKCTACTSPFICTACPSRYYLHTFSDDYVKCMPCPNNERKCVYRVTGTSKMIRTYEVESGGFDAAITGWTVSGMSNITNANWYCRSLQYFGRFAAGNWMRKTYTNLPIHYGLQVEFQLFRMDSWDGENFYVRMGLASNSPIIFQKYYIVDGSGSNECETFKFFWDFDSDKDRIDWFTSTLQPHKAETLELRLDSNLNEAVEDESWGVADFRVIYYLCTDPDCIDCSGDNTCSACKPGKYVLNAVCYTECPNGYWENTETGFCEPCMSNCELCFNATYCEYCNETYYFDGTQCNQVCPYGSWEYNYTRSCQPCPPACKDCSNPTSCSECNDGFYYLLDQCRSYCPEGYYPDGADNECKVCVAPCFGCNSPSSTDCTSCDVGTYLYENTCIPDCTIHNLWNDFYTNRCGSCHESCVACSGDQPNQCLECNPNHWLQGGWCNTTCPSHKYPNNNTWTCETCSNSCKDCSGPGSNKCTSCNTGKYLSGTECLDNCPPGTWKNGATYTCDACSLECSACTDLTHCTECPDELYLQNQQCKSTCTGAFYPNDDNNKCDACNGACKTCTGETSNDCIECATGLNFYKGKCVTSCPDGSYAKDGYCVNCPNGCQTCNSIATCQLCESGYELNEKGQCFTTSCSFSCKTCNGATSNDCLSCPTEKLLQGTQCKNACDKGYKRESMTENICQKCQSGCKECIEGEYLFGDRCFAVCPTGTQPALLDALLVCVPPSDTPIIELINIPSLDSKVALNKDLLINLEVSYAGTERPLIWWDTVSVEKTAKDALFQGLNLNNSNLIIPKANLRPDTSYTLMISVAIGNTTTTQQFTFQTVLGISEGTFTITPNEGLYFETSFTVTLNNWNQAGFDVYYDVYTYYYEFNHIKEEFEIQERTAIQTEVKNTGSAEKISFKIPPAPASRNQTVEILIYSDSDRLVRTKTIKLNEISNSQLETALNKIDMDSLTEPNDIAVYGQALLQLYDISPVEKAASKMARKVAKNYIALSGDSTFCPNDIYCSGKGTCKIEDDARICQCQAKYAGTHCEFDKAVYDEVQKKMSVLLNKLISTPLSSKNLRPMLSSFKALTAQPSLLPLDKASLIMKMYFNVTETDFVDKETATAVYVGISDLLELALGTPVLKMKHYTELRRTIKSATKFIIDGMNIGETVSITSDALEAHLTNPIEALTQINTVDFAQMEEEEAIANEENGNRLLELQRVSPRRIPERNVILTQLKDNFTLDTAIGSSFELPPLTFEAKAMVTFAIQESVTNLIDAGNAKKLVSTTTSLEVKDGNSIVSIQDLKKPITIMIPKISPTNPATTSLKYKCTYYNANTNLFSSEGCELIGETMTHIICSCTHLTEFGAIIDDEVPEGETPVQPQISFNGLMELQAQQLAESSKLTYLFTYFNLKYEKYVEVPVETPPSTLYGVYFLIPFYLIFAFLLIKTYAPPALDQNNKLSSFMTMLKDKKKKGQQIETRNIDGITAAAFFSVFITRKQSLKYPRHIRLLHFFALISMMCAFAALIASLFVGSASIKSVLTTKFIIILGGLLTIILANTVYDLTVGLVNYRFIRKISTPTTNKEATRLRIKQTVFLVLMGILFDVLVFVMLKNTPESLGHFLGILSLSLIVDLFIFDIGVWVYAPTSKYKILKNLLQARAFYIEEIAEIKSLETTNPDALSRDTEILNLNVKEMNNNIKFEVLESETSIAISENIGATTPGNPTNEYLNFLKKRGLESFGETMRGMLTQESP